MVVDGVAVSLVTPHKCLTRSSDHEDRDQDSDQDQDPDQDPDQDQDRDHVSGTGSSFRRVLRKDIVFFTSDQENKECEGATDRFSKTAEVLVSEVAPVSCGMTLCNRI